MDGSIEYIGVFIHDRLFRFWYPRYYFRNTGSPAYRNYRLDTGFQAMTNHGAVVTAVFESEGTIAPPLTSQLEHFFQIEPYGPAGFAHVHIFSYPGLPCDTIHAYT